MKRIHLRYMFTEGKYAKSRKPIPYKREKPIEQIRWDNLLSQIVNPMDDNKPYTNGEGRGHCLGKEGPKRVIYSITRLRTNDNSEYLLSNGAITGTINLETDSKRQLIILRNILKPNLDLRWAMK